MPLGDIVLIRQQIKRALEDSQKTGRPPILFVQEEDLKNFSFACSSMTDEFIKYNTMPIVVLDKVTVQRGNALLFTTLTLLAEAMAKLTRTKPTKVLQRFGQTAKELMDSMSEAGMLEYLKKYGVVSQTTTLEDVHAQVNAENN